MFNCPNQMYCGNPSQFGISLNDDGAYNDPVDFYAISTFDNLGKSLLTVFRIISTEGWNLIMTNLMDADIPVLAVLYCFSLIIFGAFFMMNLILAVIIQAFISISRKEIDAELGKDTRITSDKTIVT